MTTIPDLVDKYAGEMARLVVAAQANPSTIEGKSWTVMFADSLFRFHHECNELSREMERKTIRSIVSPSIIDLALQKMVTGRKR